MWSISDKGEADSTIQSIFFQEFADALLDGVNGVNCVLSGLAVTGGADMTPAVAKGSVLSNSIMYAIAAADVTVTAADATNPRIDLIVVTSAGALAVRAGTPAAAPLPPARTSNDVIIAAVYIPANDTSIGASQITDLRVMRTNGPICIYRTSTAETTDTTATAIEALNKANSGVTIPSGLFLAGHILRLRMGGNMLLNSGTPTVRYAILYGGTTLFSDISGTNTADADRRAWSINVDLTAQGNSDQALTGKIYSGRLAGVSAPTTGIGDIWSGSWTYSAISGSAAVDSDAANRLLSVQITFNVSNAANQLVTEYATLELI